MSKCYSDEERIFHAARAISDEAERAAYLDTACAGDASLRARIDALLEAGKADDGWLRMSVLAAEDALDISSLTEKPGDVIGRYKLLEQIGEGGFGVVYMAEQVEPVRRRVALKIIKLGMETKAVIARFEAERQALALMDHPNIARVFDAGATETGRPYFVMELVKGIPITDYCDQNNLTTEERLQLFTQVCSAVQHAHQKAIIHRDLKPTNVLVTLHDGTPVPKIIDFGVAKAMDRPLTEKTLFTSFRQFVGTPHYMSPEQAVLGGPDIDTRSDIYALGVLLYELLTGTPPFEAETLRPVAYEEMCRIIREVEPPKPSTRLSTMGDRLTEVAKHRHAEPEALSKLIRGDLDWIVMNALEKDRTRRYETATGLAEDIQRHLNHEPVVAGPPAVAYRLRKFVKRNRVKLTAGVAVAVALVLGLSLAAAGLVQAIRQRDRALEAYRAQAEAKRKQELAEQRADEQERLAEAERLAKEDEAAARREEERWGLLAEARSLVEVPSYSQALVKLKEAASIRHDHATHLPLRFLAEVYSDHPLATLSGHTGQVNSVAFCPDGTALASAGEDGSVRLWDLSKGEEVRTFVGHTGHADSVAFSPDGRTLASGEGRRDGKVRLWEVATGRQLHVLSGHHAAVCALAFSPDGRTLASAGTMGDATVRLWDVATGQERLTLSGHIDSITTVAFAPDGKSLASSGWDRKIRLWDAVMGEELRETSVEGGDESAVSIVFSPDGRTLASGDSDGKVRLRDAATGEVLTTLGGHTSAVRSVAFSPDGTALVSGSSDTTVKVWQLGPSPTVRTFGGHTDDVFSVAFSPDGTTVASAAGAKDETIRLWDATHTQGTRLFGGHTGLVWGVAYSPDGRILVSTSWYDAIRLRDVTTGRELRSFASDHDKEALSVAFSPDSTMLASASRDQTIKLYEVSTGKELRTLVGHDQGVNAVAFSPDGKILASGARDRTIRVWDVGNGRELHVVSAPLAYSGRVAFSPDGKTLTSTSMERYIKLWDVAGGMEFRTVQTGHAGGVTAVAFSPDGKIVASGSGDCTIKLLDAAAGKELVTLRGHSQAVRSVVFSPDGRCLASTSEDGTMRLWDADTGQEIVTVPFGTEVRSVVFSPDGRALACGVPYCAVQFGLHAYDGDIERWLDLPAQTRQEGKEMVAREISEEASGVVPMVKREDGKVWIEGLRGRPAWITHMGCLMGCMQYLGNDASRGWAYGGSGFAFALNIHEAVCPSGPTAWPEEKCDALASNIGVVVERVVAHKGQGDLAAIQEQAWKKVRGAIDAGLPCFGWELDIPEWYVIHGYDEEGNILFRDFGGEERKVHHTKLGDTGIGVAAVMVVKPGPVADDRTTVRDALAFAIEHGAGKHSYELYHTGLAGYDAWIAALENEELATTDEVIGFGQGYNGMCWAECRRRAVQFLTEAKERLDDAELAPLFDEAIKHYTTASESLNQVSRIFPFDPGQQAAMAERAKDPERRRQAVTALKTAREAEAAGLEALASIAVALGAQSIDANALPARRTAAHQPSEQREETSMGTSVEQFRYGFRYDPIGWVEHDTTLQGALVRTYVFERSKEGDGAMIEAEIGKVLSGQQENGSFEDDPHKTAETVRRLLGLGYPADTNAVGAAASWLRSQLTERQQEPQEMLGVAAALCEAGHTGAPELQNVLNWARAADKEKLVTDIAATCPWSLTDRLQELWGCRRAEGMDAPLQTMIDLFQQNVTPAGTMCFVDTGGLYRVFGEKDCPSGRETIRRMVPRILRSQRPDGGWGSESFDVLRALVNHDLLDELLPLPPLPSDWQTVRALDLPDTELYGLTWGNGALWVCDRSKGEVMAISPEDGSIQKRLALPGGPGAEIGWWEGLLVHTQGVPQPQPRQADSQRLFLIDPDSGKVQKEFALDWIPRITSATQMHDEQYGDKLWLCDPGEGILYYLDPRTGEHDYGPDVADANVKRVFPADQGVWNASWEHSMLLESDRNGWRLLDYGDMPFSGPTDYFSHPGQGYCDGLAWDGENLWALDAREKRLCVIEKTESGKEVTAALAARR